MKISIDTKILSKENLTLGEFLIMLLGFYNVDYKNTMAKLKESKLAETSWFDSTMVILSDNSKHLVEKILLESDEKAKKCGIDFERLAKKMQDVYPNGTKSGTTYDWRGKTEDVAQKLRALVVIHDFKFTEEEAIQATKDYVNSFGDKKEKMSLLKYFILRTIKEDGGYDIESMFMSTVENNRKE